MLSVHLGYRKQKCIRQHCMSNKFHFADSTNKQNPGKMHIERGNGLLLLFTNLFTTHKWNVNDFFLFSFFIFSCLALVYIFYLAFIEEIHLDLHHIRCTYKTNNKRISFFLFFFFVIFYYLFFFLFFFEWMNFMCWNGTVLCINI